ncbi:MAG: DUF11 domain-containing protein, partial [Acidimicrobiia bacterium]|nr:DUF11 domain-containing protein [Acidimicrobiia bacterium]
MHSQNLETRTKRATQRFRKVAVIAVITLLASTVSFSALLSPPAQASAADITSMGFFGSELIWQPGEAQPVHDTATNTVSSMGPVKDVVCGTIVTFFQEIVMAATGTDNVLEISYNFGYDSSSDEGLGLRDIVGLTIHPDSIDLDGDAAVSVLSEAVTPNPDVPGTVRLYQPVIEVTGLDASETIWVQIDIIVGCDPGTGSTGTAQAAYTGAIETTSGEPLGGGNLTIPGLSPSAPPSWSFTKEPFNSQGDPVTVADPFEEITFLFTIANNGLVPLTPPTLADDGCAPIVFVGGDANANNTIDSASPEWPQGTFGIPPDTPAETWTWECTTTIGSGGHTNSVTLAGMPRRGVGATSDTVSFPVNPKVVDLAVTKTVDPQFFGFGDTVTWTIEADNTGNVPLPDVTVTDADCPGPVFVGSSDLDGDGELDTNETWQWTCTSAAL